MTDPIAALDRAAAAIRGRLAVAPDRAIVLGSGLSGFADRLADPVVIPYAEIPGFPAPTVHGHRGQLLAGTLQGAPVLALAGRFHFYEGHPLSTVVMPVRVLARLGVKTLMLTNAAGGVNASFAPGDLMLIADHLNLTGQNPLIGDNPDELGPRFPDMTYAYDPGLKATARRAAKERGITLKEGVYAWMTGPSYETPAEIRYLRTIGADAAGMSTVPEAIAAVHAGMKVLGVSLITNLAAGVLDRPLSHQEVIETAKAAAARFEALAEGILTGI